MQPWTPTGTTSLAAVIGSPVRHSRSPAIHNAAFRALGLDWTYLAFDVAAGEAGRAIDAMRALGLGGLSVTMPHKDAVVDLVDELTDDARRLGAVNCVTPRSGRLIGDNTDGAGFIASLADAGVSVGGRSCVVLGAGGAARAVVLALADIGIACERLDAGHAPTPRPIARWCFAEPGRDDLVTTRGKLLGSAQRRVQTPSPRVLHHGSLVLTTPALTPFVAAVADAQPIDPSLRTRLGARLVHHFARVLALEPHDGTLTSDETALARQLQRDVYERDADLHRR